MSCCLSPSEAAAAYNEEQKEARKAKIKELGGIVIEENNLAKQLKEEELEEEVRIFKEEYEKTGEDCECVCDCECGCKCNDDKEVEKEVIKCGDGSDCYFIKELEDLVKEEWQYNNCEAKTNLLIKINKLINRYK